MQPVRADTVEAHTIDVLDGTGNRHFLQFLHVLGHCPSHHNCVSFAYFTLPPGRVCEACFWLPSKISLINRGIWQISWGSEIDRPKVLKEARCCQLVRTVLFPFAPAPAKCGKMARRYTYTRTSVFDRRQSFASLQLVWTGWWTYDGAQMGWKDRSGPK